MSERFGIHFKKLFEIKLFHHYWLDEGAVQFDQITDQDKKNNRLASYDVRNFLAVSPSDSTSETLNGFGCTYKATAQGVIVVVPENTILPNDVAFEWAVMPTDPKFLAYTTLTLKPQKIYRLYHALEKRFYMYKENVSLLSNLTGVARGTGINKTLFLSQEFPVLKADDKIEALVKVGGALSQLVNDQPGGITKTINAQVSKSPVFVHQGDVPTISLPPGLEGAPKFGITMTTGMPESIFAMISIAAVRNDNAAFSIIDSKGRPKLKAPVFEIHFKNRSTYWRYINKTNGVFVSEETEPLPLTYFGNSGAKQKPSAGLPKKNDKEGTPIPKGSLVSEIFI